MTGRWRTIIDKFFLFGILIVFATAGISQGQVSSQDHSWLNGTWEGKAHNKRTMQMELELVNGNRVKGTARGEIIRRKARNRDQSIEGTVDGDKVRLTVFDNQNRHIEYVLNYINGNLIGTVTNPSKSDRIETIFRKIK